MMQLPFPIRGTDEWDNREYQRFLDGCAVMSFGPLTDEIVNAKKLLPVVRRIRVYLDNRGVSPAKISEFVNKYRGK